MLDVDWCQIDVYVNNTVHDDSQLQHDCGEKTNNDENMNQITDEPIDIDVSTVSKRHQQNGGQPVQHRHSHLQQEHTQANVDSVADWITWHWMMTDS